MNLTEIGSAPCAKEFAATLPAGHFWCGDPCYVLGDTWDAVIELLYKNNVEHNVLIQTELGQMLIWSTAHGDGCFPIMCTNGAFTPTDDMTLGVDSGTLALIDMKIVDATKKSKDDIGSGARLTLNDATVFIIEQGDLRELHHRIIVNTSGRDEEDDEYSHADDCRSWEPWDR